MRGEISLRGERLVAYYGLERPGVHLPFNFQLIQAPWNACEIDRMIVEYDKAVPEEEWPNWVLGNHDRHRLASRIGVAQARVAAMLLLTLRGTPTLYYGDEIGMHDVPIPAGQVEDPFEKNVPGLGLGRDPERTPMQWAGDERAGFTMGRPWLPIADDYETINVTAQRSEETSILTLYHRLIELRRAEPALSVGGFAPLPADNDLISYVRKTDERRLLVVLNLGAKARRFSMTELHCRAAVLLSTHL